MGREVAARISQLAGRLRVQREQRQATLDAIAQLRVQNEAGGRHAGRTGELGDAREAPVHDPGTFETNVPGIFVAGGAIAGVDTGTIFIENGRFHGEKIIETIASRL